MRIGRPGLLVVATVLCCWHLHKSVVAGIEGDAELLRLVANGYKSNREKISTWQGKALITRKGQFQGASELHDRVRDAVFVYDSASASKRWNITHRTSKATTLDGALLWEAEPDSDYQMSVNAMVKNGAFYRYRNYQPKSYTGPRPVLINDLSAVETNNVAEDLDPEYYLTVLGDDVYDKLMRTLGYRDRPDADKRVSRAGNIMPCSSYGS